MGRRSGRLLHSDPILPAEVGQACQHDQECEVPESGASRGRRCGGAAGCCWNRDGGCRRRSRRRALAAPRRAGNCCYGFRGLGDANGRAAAASALVRAILASGIPGFVAAVADVQGAFLSHASPRCKGWAEAIPSFRNTSRLHFGWFARRYRAVASSLAYAAEESRLTVSFGGSAMISTGARVALRFAFQCDANSLKRSAVLLGVAASRRNTGPVAAHKRA